MKNTYLLITFLGASLFLISCSEQTQEISSEDSMSKQYDLALQDKSLFFKKLSKVADNPENKSTAEKIDLGHKLYFDTKLSKDENISCNSCHNLQTYGVDNLPTSPGDAGENGGRNSPTVLNAALHNWQFWDGREPDVEAQAGGPILNPIEMAIPSKEYLMNRLKQIPEYQAMFKAAYPDESNPFKYENVQKAIGLFERQLLTPSRFDDFLSGNSDALTLQEKKGMLAFASYNCTQCHNGELLGGNSFQKFGVHQNYWEHTKSENIDKGKFDLTGDETHMYVFKVPSLRNIAQTGPYFHDGSVTDLNEAVKIMAKTQLNINLKDSEVENMVAFLNSLTGEVPSAYTTAP